MFDRRPDPTKSPTPKALAQAQQQHILSSEDRYLWEHASLLCHSFEHREATDCFVRLARRHPARRYAFLINAGLIHAHLGEHTLALELFTYLASTDGTALIHFLIALVQYELYDYGAAAWSFQDSLCHLAEHTMYIDYGGSGLRFTITAGMLLENIRMATAARNGKMVHPALYGLPAGVIFEPPERLVEQVATHDRIEFRSVRYGLPVLSPTRASALLHTASTHLDPPSIASPSTSSLVSPKQEQPKERKKPQRLQLASVSEHCTQISPVIRAITWADVKALEIDVKALQAEQNKKRSNLVPREARVRTEPLSDLAKFVRLSGPGRGQSLAWDMLDDIDAHMAIYRPKISPSTATPREHTRNDSAVEVEPALSQPAAGDLAATPAQRRWPFDANITSSPSTEHPRPTTRRHSSSSFYSTSRSSSPQPYLLKPLAYAPPSPRILHHSTSLDSGKSNARTYTTHPPNLIIRSPLPSSTSNPLFRPLRAIHSIDSPTSTIQGAATPVRREHMRNATMESLQGKPKLRKSSLTKPLPAPPTVVRMDDEGGDGVQTPMTIDSSVMFDYRAFREGGRVERSRRR